MRSFGRVALLSALALSSLAALALAGEQMEIALRDRAPVVDHGTDDITGSIGDPRKPSPALTDEQRGHIFDSVMRLRNAPLAEMPPTAAAVPRSVPLQDLPATVTREIPEIEGYKFVKLDDRILLVNPLDRAVVAELPRYKVMLD